MVTLALFNAVLILALALLGCEYCYCKQKVTLLSNEWPQSC